MPYRTSAFPRHKGWWHDQINGRIVAVYNGTEIFDFDGNDIVITQATTLNSTLGGLTGLTVTTGNATVTAGDLRVTAGNARLGAVSAFATTEPTSWLVCKSGTQPAGAIATSGGVGANDTTVQKIIAAGTINNVET